MIIINTGLPNSRTSTKNKHQQKQQQVMQSRTICNNYVHSECSRYLGSICHVSVPSNDIPFIRVNANITSLCYKLSKG